jgi:DNA helicase IV
MLSQSWRLSLHASDRHTIQIMDARDKAISTSAITDISVQKGIIWCSLEIASIEGAVKLDGLSSQKARSMLDAIIRHINLWIDSELESSLDQLGVFDSTIQALIANQNQYLAKADVTKAIAGVGGEISIALAHPFFRERMLSDSIRKLLPPSLDFLTNPRSRDKYNQAFLSAELVRFKDYFDSALATPLTYEQREACIRLEDSNLLVAAAGSGKTATMVSKVVYLLKKKLYKPHEILVLAYNKDAAEELRTRISELLDVNPDDLEVKVSTFHALGLNVIETVNESPPKIANWVEHAAGRTQVVSQIIKEISDNDAEFSQLWKELLIYYPKADLPVHSFSCDIDYQRYIADRSTNNNATVMTQAGNIFVRSLQEQRIVNWLWEHQVEFKYEETLTGLRDQNGKSFTAKPDFYYTQTQTYHEHLAINSNGSSPFDGYIEKTKSKRTAYKLSGIDYFETTSADVEKNELIAKLEKELTTRDIMLDRRPHEEVLKAVSPVVMRRYHTLLLTCIQHIRASRLTAEMLRVRADTLHDKKRAKIFIEVVMRVTEAFERKLAQEGSIDFDSMIGGATDLVASGRYNSPFSLILVDEFQDISPSRASLIRALKNQRPFTKLFTVGDDWQSIYRFTGSDITIFTDFDEYFGDCWKGKLQTTFRSNQTIATTAGDFVKKNPQQIAKSVAAIKGIVKHPIRAIPVNGSTNKHAFSATCNRLLSRMNYLIASKEGDRPISEIKKLKVYLLGRYRHLDPKGIQLERSHLSAEFMTFHKAKGLESDYTILLDVSEGAYGVPSQIEDDELLNLVIPRPETYPYAEERRLFYVALTRASRGVFILFNQSKPSRYISEIKLLSPSALRYESVDGKEILSCSRCGEGFMLLRKSKKNASEFLGCSNFPVCKNTIPT